MPQFGRTGAKNAPRDHWPGACLGQSVGRPARLLNTGNFALHHQVFDDIVRIDAVLVRTDVTKCAVEVWRLKVECFQVDVSAAMSLRMGLKGANQGSSNSLATVLRCNPKLLQFATAPPASAYCSANHATGWVAGKAGQRRHFMQRRSSVVELTDAVVNDGRFRGRTTVMRLY